jgi:hypothetical protein
MAPSRCSPPYTQSFEDVEYLVEAQLVEIRQLAGVLQWQSVHVT